METHTKEVRICRYEKDVRQKEVEYKVCVPHEQEQTYNVTVCRVVPEEKTITEAVCVPVQVEKEIEVPVCKMVAKTITCCNAGR
jgi:hypothetical protein